MTRRATNKITEVIRKFLVFMFFTVGIIVTLSPLVWMVRSSLVKPYEVVTIPIRFFPGEIMWSNYKDVLAFAPMGRSLLNSLIVATAVTISVLFTASAGGFAFGKLRFPGRDTIFLIILSTLMIPFFLLSIPLFVIIGQRLGLLNTYLGLIVPFLATAFGIFLMRQFILGIPGQLIDAARLDGCSYFRIYWSIVLPLSKPALSALAIFTFMGNWDSFLWPLLIVHKSEMYTLPMAVNMLRSMGVTSVQLQMAGCTIAVIPMIIIFFILQRQFVGGITLTGLKY